MVGSRQCIAISKVISGGSEQGLILTTESKVRSRSGSGENISESFSPAAGEKVGTKDGGLNCFFPTTNTATYRRSAKKGSTQTTERRERGLALLSLLFPLIRPPNEQKVDGWEPLKTKV